MVRAPPCHGGGRGFESHPGRSISFLYTGFAGVAELADAQDLKSCGTNLPYRFDSGRRHYQKAVKLSIYAGFDRFFIWCGSGAGKGRGRI